MDITSHIEAMGLSRSDICTAAGISRGMLSQIETGRRRIGPARARRFASALGVPVAAVRPDLAELVRPDPAQPSSKSAA